MKEKLSIHELKAFCEENPPNQITYYAENQDTACAPCRFRLHFQTMQVYENPNLIYLCAGNGSLCFMRVKWAEIDTESSVLGTILKLYCKRPETPRSTAVYTLIIS